jgi:localization factor PodJL
MRYVPWHVKGVRPELRAVARDAARRSGLTVGAWLNSLIVDAAAGCRRLPSFDPVVAPQPTRTDALGFAKIREDIDELKRQISQIDHATFDRRLDEIERRIGALQRSTHCDGAAEALRRDLAEFRDTLKEAPPVEAIAKVWRHDLEQISVMFQDAMPASAIAALEGQVRVLVGRLDEHRRAEITTGAALDVEQALADIRDRLGALTPAEELGELGDAVMLLSSRADSIATESAAPEKTQLLEHAIRALQGLASQVASRDVIAALSHDIKALDEKIDRIARPAVDFMRTLERHLAEIAEVVRPRTPDEGAPAAANCDAVRALVDRLEAVQIPTADHVVLRSLEQRIDILVEKLASFEPQAERGNGTDRGMEELIAQLKELRDQNESRLAAIQQQVATSAADAISGPAESIRRDVASLKEIQTSVDRRTQDTFEAVYGTIEQVVDRLAVIEDELRDRHFGALEDRSADKSQWSSAPAPPPYPPLHAGEGREGCAPAVVAEAPALVPLAAPVANGVAPAIAMEPHGADDWGAAGPRDVLSVHQLATTGKLRCPAVPDFAADASVEPSFSAGRVRVVANAIDRIAASEAANGIAKAAETQTPARATFVAAARRAARAVANEDNGTPAGQFEKSGHGAGRNILLGAIFARLRPRTKSLALGFSVVLFVFGALRVTLEFSRNYEGRESVRPVTAIEADVAPGGESTRSEPLALDPPPPQGANLESTKSPVPFTTNPRPTGEGLGKALGWGISPAMVTPATISVSAPAQMSAATPDMDAFSPMRNALLQGQAAREPASPYTSSAVPDLTELPLPPTIGGKALLAAAAAGDPNACFEIGVRFAQGRNVAQDLAMAAAWLERAARKGMAPAQFRLGGMYEKGLGVEKDLVEAHRLYVAAADKGHAKAMHNLAVLYAGGLDGKPDYALASQWFRRAAAHGIVDSQYNLAILYARGVGVERNLAESYKWFALAAKGGDKDAARKRDEIATRLDPKQLERATLNAESFVAVPQPDEATIVKAPAGGWDEVGVAATTKPKALVRPERFSRNQDPTR